MATTKRPRPGTARGTTATKAQKSKRLSDAELLRRAIDLTIDPATDEPVTDRRFAETVLKIHERTLRKKLDGRRLTPLERERCEQIVARPAFGRELVEAADA